jgi:hypothetical protein
MDDVLAFDRIGIGLLKEIFTLIRDGLLDCGSYNYNFLEKYCIISTKMVSKLFYFDCSLFCSNGLILCISGVVCLS